VSVINTAYENKGNSVKDFKNIYGEEGSHQKYIKVYMKDKDPYGNKVIKEKCNHGRKIHYVPGLQKKKVYKRKRNESESESEESSESEIEESSDSSESSNESD